MRPTFFSYVNPLQFQNRIKEDDEGNQVQVPEEDVNSFDPESNVFTIGGSQFARTANPFSLAPPVMPLYAGKNRSGDLQEAPSSFPGTAAIARPLANADIAVNQQRQKVAGQAEKFASLIENQSTLDPSLVGIRDKLRGKIESAMNANPIAGYNPKESGVKGDLRHIGESLLLGLANAPRNADGYVDPLVAGVAASSTALFGSGGTHNAIARQFIQPRLDEQLARQRQNLVANEQDFGTLEKMYPSNAPDRIKAAEIRLQSQSHILGSAEADRQSQQSSYEKEQNRQNQLAIEKEKRANMLDMALLQAGLKNTADGKDRADGRLSFSQKVESEVSDLMKEAGEAKIKFIEADSKVKALTARLQSGEARPSEEAELRKELVTAQAQRDAYDEALSKTLPAKVGALNQRFRGPVVAYNEKDRGVYKTSNYQNSINSTYDSAFSKESEANNQNKKITSPILQSAVEEWKRRHGR